MSGVRRIGRLLFYVRRYWLQAIASVVLLAAVGLLDAFRVLLIGPIFNTVLNPKSPGRDLSLFGGRFHVSLQQFVPSHFHNPWSIVAYALIVSTVLKGICDYAGTYLVNYAGFGMITDLRDDLYQAILRRSVQFFQRHATGTILSTVINDIERVQYAMSSVLSEFLQQFFTLIFTACFAVVLGGKLAWVLLIFVPVVISSARRVGRSVRHTTRHGQDKLAEIQNILHETITGNRIVKAFTMERWEMTRFKEAARRLFHANLSSVRAQAISSPLMDIIGAIAIALLLYVGRGQIRSGALTTGTFFAFLVAVFKLYDPVRKFALFYNNFQQALGASGNIFEFMDEQDTVRDRPHAQGVKAFRNQIHFEDVRFSYASEEGEKEVLSGINLTVPRGEVVAFVGPSGAGKTTLVNLIPRFFDVTGGRLLMDGQDVRDLKIDSLRRLIGNVTQETILFNDTVRNNIAYGQPDVPLEKVKDAARVALAHDFISAMPEGYDTVIGEKGFRLSGGERQRLAIARALLKNAPILILDEATSSLDVPGEQAVQHAMDTVLRGRTAVIIAHRLSTVEIADRVLVMRAGRVIEDGTPAELIADDGHFAGLHQAWEDSLV